MTCPAVNCTAPTPQLGDNPMSMNVTRVTSCDGCEIVAVPPANAVRQPTRTITMGQDPCVTPPTPPTQVYEATKTVTISQAFFKNNCTTGTGSSVTYTATGDGTAYSTISQADADVKANQVAQNAAQDDLVGNGQANANFVGTCT